MNKTKSIVLGMALASGAFAASSAMAATTLENVKEKGTFNVA